MMEKGMAVLDDFPVDDGMRIHIRMGYGATPCFLVYFNQQTDVLLRKNIHSIILDVFPNILLTERIRTANIDDIEASLDEISHHTGVLCFDEMLDEAISSYVDSSRYFFFALWRFNEDDEHSLRSRLSSFFKYCGVL